MREKELRLALVCYGGVSLAVYMHGVTKEIWKLLKASQALHDPDPAARAALSDSETIYLELLEAVGAHIRLRVMVDIVAGASAGGINGIFLAHAIAGGHDMECLRDLWLSQADVEELLDPEARPNSVLTKIYARPLAWFVGHRKMAGMEETVAPVARAEVRRKLSHFVRARWFEPPFSGIGFTAKLLDALEAMRQGPRTKPLLPDGQPLDLFVTVTDYHGFPDRLRLHSPPEVVETEHRRVIGFSHVGSAHKDNGLASSPSLAFAARATASFPGAFPAAQIGEIDTLVATRAMRWSDREAFIARTFPRHVKAGIDVHKAALIDGSVLSNAPFAPAIAALRNRPAHREVDRRFVYIDPKSGHRGFGSSDAARRPPGFFSMILRALADIPREQPIRDDLESIDALSQRMRRLRHVVGGMRPDVDAAIARAVGEAVQAHPPTPERLAAWRARVNLAATQEAGFGYSAYAHLKLSQVIEQLADLLIAIDGHEEDRSASENLRALLWAQVRARGLDQLAGHGDPGKGRADFIAFLRRFDLGFRIRRLRFLIRRLTELQMGLEPQYMAACDQMRSALYDMLSPFLALRDKHHYGARLKFALHHAQDAPDQLLESLGTAMDLQKLDADIDARFVTTLTDNIPENLRHQLLLAYLGFPFFDLATLPLLQGEGLDEFDDIKVDRLSPEDATAIRSGGTQATLRGIEFNSFGAFFSRAYRENDYLWGRLHGADRLIDIVISAMPEGSHLAPGVAFGLKQRAFAAILAAEAPYLHSIPEVFASITKELGLKADLSTTPSTA